MVLFFESCFLFILACYFITLHFLFLSFNHFTHPYFIFSFRLFYHWTFKKSMHTGREVVSGPMSHAWSQCYHYLKRPKATSPIPPCALKFHPRSVRTHIQDQKAAVLFYTAAPVPTYCLIWFLSFLAPGNSFSSFLPQSLAMHLQFCSFCVTF